MRRDPTTPCKPKSEPRASVKLVRCAIYTRKSTEEGLEQEFNSLDAQREAGEAYVRSQAGEGWVVLAERYDDGGYTGPTPTAPACSGSWPTSRPGGWIAWSCTRWTGCPAACSTSPR